MKALVAVGSLSGRVDQLFLLLRVGPPGSPVHTDRRERMTDMAKQPSKAKAAHVEWEWRLLWWPHTPQARLNPYAYATQEEAEAALLRFDDRDDVVRAVRVEVKVI